MKVRKLGFLDSFFMVITDVLIINAGYILAFIRVCLSQECIFNRSNDTISADIAVENILFIFN
ncbi:hypothetical protein D2962_13220 [Biomaibacter acetigenes]|uniref:Uncharacterized protein n=1 Tax=Biomaibacter acetigenes TaxID=2316383 RepID=A0A3G2R7P2_9FIRM|nr:hypothetical protein D2962_13220 [Biomaibacter acetigenes]MDN5301088.1 hypothetical protein [Thermoanaerobacteraceae bacterium]RKL61361.1 hypothetical protein DXT63_17145 [Thermoanaerobacteraceae bacterium SP2]